MVSAERFWDKRAESYSKSPIGDEAAYHYKLEKTQEYLSPESRVLEFGCGTGSTALIHAPLVGHIHAIDVSSKMIEIARHKAEKQNISNVTFEHKDIAGFDAADETFDVVMGMSILHLLEDPDSAIDKVFHLLKPGGVFISSTACMTNLLRAIRILGPVGRYFGLLPTLNIPTQSALENQMRFAGFELAHVWQPAAGKAVFIVARKPA